MKIIYSFLNLIVLLFIFSCSTEFIQNQVDSNTVQKMLTKYVNVSWKLNSKYMTDLPPKIKEELIKSCGSSKYILVKISTIDFEKTKGTFRCN